LKREVVPFIPKFSLPLTLSSYLSLFLSSTRNAAHTFTHTLSRTIKLGVEFLADRRKSHKQKLLELGALHYQAPFIIFSVIAISYIKTQLINLTVQFL
jgi:hypothetical protein